MSYYVLENKSKGGYYYTQIKRSNPLTQCFIWTCIKKAQKHADTMSRAYGEVLVVVPATLSV